MCPPLDSFSTLRILSSALIKSPNFVEHCNLIHALLALYSTPCTRCFCLLTGFTIGIFLIMSEQVVVSSCMGTDDTFLTLGIFYRVSHRASVTAEGSFSAILCSSTTSRFASPYLSELKKMHLVLIILLQIVVTDPALCPPLLVLAQGSP